LPDHCKANTYGWWSYFVGGPIFRNQNSSKNIHGEKWWIHNYFIPWGIGSEVTIETSKDADAWTADLPGNKDNWVKATKFMGDTKIFPPRGVLQSP
jgi:hypothetical protein